MGKRAEAQAGWKHQLHLHMCLYEPDSVEVVYRLHYASSRLKTLFPGTDVYCIRYSLALQQTAHTYFSLAQSSTLSERLILTPSSSWHFSDSVPLNPLYIFFYKSSSHLCLSRLFKVSRNTPFCFHVSTFLCPGKKL